MNEEWSLLQLYLPAVSLSLIEDGSALMSFKDGKIHFIYTGRNVPVSPCMVCLDFNKKRKDFWGEEDNGVITVVVIQRSPVGYLQDWKVL